MDREIASRKKREMQPEDFQRLLARLDRDPARASEAYEHLRRELIRFFGKTQQSFQAEELADAALDEIAKKPDSYPIKNVNEFAIGVARYVRLRRFRDHATATRLNSLQSYSGDGENPEQAILQGMDRERRVKCFLQCIESFRPEERQLILEYYPAENCDLEERRRRLAGGLGIDANALNSRMNRLRAKLVKCCAGCYPSAPRSR